MRCERRQGWLLVLVLCWPVDSSRPVVRLPSVGVVAGSGGIRSPTDSESESDSDYMTETMWDVWVD